MKTACEESEMMPTMQQIDQIERALLALVVSEIARDEIPRLCAAARRGVEARQEVSDADAAAYKWMILSSDLQKRTEQLEAELAALKAERDDLAASAASLSADVSALGGELEALKAAQTDQRGPDAQDNAGAGIDAASQARCEHSGPHPKGESDE